MLLSDKNHPDSWNVTKKETLKNIRFYHILANQRFREGSHRNSQGRILSCANYFSDWFFSSLLYSARNSSSCIASKWCGTFWMRATATVMMICTPAQPSVSHSIQLDKQAWAFRFLKVRLLKMFNWVKELCNLENCTSDDYLPTLVYHTIQRNPA